MIDNIVSPQWFYGNEIIIDAIGAIVLFLISYFSLKCYTLNRKNKNYAYLAAAFFLIGISYVFKILTNIIVYYFGVAVAREGVVMVTQLTLWSSHAPYTLGVLMYRFLTILGLYILYRLSEKKLGLSWQDNVLVLFLFAALIYFTQNYYYIFYATALLLLFMITYNYAKIYMKNKSSNTKALTFSFGLLGTSQLMLFFTRIEMSMLVIGEIVQLTAYIIMLVIFIMVLNNGKKKK